MRHRTLQSREPDKLADSQIAEAPPSSERRQWDRSIGPSSTMAISSHRCCHREGQLDDVPNRRERQTMRYERKAMTLAV